MPHFSGLLCSQPLVVCTLYTRSPWKYLLSHTHLGRRVSEDIVGLGKLLEQIGSFRIVRILVRMVFESLFTITSGDLVAKIWHNFSKAE